MPGDVLVLGGAGFIGSRIAQRFVEAGHRVTVLDAIVPDTGANRTQVPSEARFVEADAGDTAVVAECLEGKGLVIDALAWTSHHGAMRDPGRDLQLNVASHLGLLGCLVRRPVRTILLGTRAQYGRDVAMPVIDEGTPMVPTDVQGVHKVAAESLFRVYAALHELDVCALRIPNCFGPHQPCHRNDIGLVGGFVRTAIRGEGIEIYEGGRRRELAYVDDVAEVVGRLGSASWSGFVPLNLGGTAIEIDELAHAVIDVAGAGSVRRLPAPREVLWMEPSAAVTSSARITALIGSPPRTDLGTALAKTVAYFRRELDG